MRRLGLSLCACLLVSIISVINCYGTSTFGTGIDGNLTVSSSIIVNNQNTNLSQSVSAGQNVIHVLDATLFNVNDNILVIQMLGGEAGVFDDLYIESIDPLLSSISLSGNLQNSYSINGGDIVQVIRIPNYSNVTIETTGVVTCYPWNGIHGGIIAFKVLDNLTNNGIITATGKGSYGSAGGVGGAGGAGGPGGVGGNGNYGIGAGWGGYGSWQNGGNGGAYGLDGEMGNTSSQVQYPGFPANNLVPAQNDSDVLHLLFGSSGAGGNGGNGGRGAGGGGGSYGYNYGVGGWRPFTGQSGASGGNGGYGGSGGSGGGIIYINSFYITGAGSLNSDGISGLSGGVGESGGAGGNGSGGNFDNFNIYYSGKGGGGDGATGGNGGDGGGGGAGGCIILRYIFQDGITNMSFLGGNGGAGNNPGAGGTGGQPGFFPSGTPEAGHGAQGGGRLLWNKWC